MSYDIIHMMYLYSPTTFSKTSQHHTPISMSNWMVWKSIITISWPLFLKLLTKEMCFGLIDWATLWCWAFEALRHACWWATPPSRGCKQLLLVCDWLYGVIPTSGLSRCVLTASTLRLMDSTLQPKTDTSLLVGEPLQEFSHERKILNSLLTEGQSYHRPLVSASAQCATDT